MRKQLPLLVLLLLPMLAWAQTVTVPKNVYFADVHLRISDAAQQQIQKKVDALHRNQTYFKIKVDLANAYFPVIERVFKNEGVPDDFKYLALQESGLIGDAISTSNAVGYWQFKREAALDFNLRMDNAVDERRHIIEASRGAALYFKRSNKNYDNWFTSLLSYYLGYSGVQTYSKPSDKGAKKMDVTEKSHPYVITFLAHKIAYDNFIGREKPVVSLREMRATPGQSLTDIALATKTDYVELEKYNKWLLGTSIPSDKDYYVMIPVRNDGSDRGLLASKGEAPAATPALSNTKQATTAASVVKRNGLNALVAQPNDTKDRLALQAGISTRKFLKYNDLHNFDEIVAGFAYYIEKKKTTADVEYHVVQPGETMQLISQHYGIRLNYLRYKNRMGRNEVPVPGRVLWLQKRRPAIVPVEIKEVSAKQSIDTTAAVKETPVVVAKEDETPKNNTQKRFFNNSKKEKEATVNESATVVQTAPVTASAPTRQAAPVTTEKAQEQKVVEAPTAEKAEAKETAPQSKIALYPSSKDKLATGSETKNPESAKAEVKPQPGQEEEAESVVYQEREKAPVTQPFSEKEATAASKPAPTKPLETKVEVAEEEQEERASVNGQKTQTVNTSTATGTIKVSAAKSPKHVVAKGESLFAISRQYNVTVAELTAWNNLSNSSLQPGQELIIAEPLALTKTPENTEAQESTTSTIGYHTVVAGETLYQISKKYNVTVEDLRTWNNLSDNNLRLGQELRVVVPATEAASTAAETSEPAPSTLETVYHTVAAGESMYQISRKYGVTIKDIMDWNKKPDFNVAPGEKLLIKKR